MTGPATTPASAPVPGRGVPGWARHDPRTSADPTALFATLEAAYGLGRWLSWRRTDSGTSNTSWFVRTESGDVVLRRSHRLKSVAGAEFECALADHLRERGFPAPPVVRTPGGAVLVQVDGVVHVVTRRLPGGPYDPHDPAHPVATARGLARYHELASDLPVLPPVPAPTTLTALAAGGQEDLLAATEVAAGLLGAAGSAAREDASHLAAQMQRVHDELGEQAGGLTRCLLHGSYGPSSVLLAQGRLTAVVDLDRAGCDLLGLDLAYALHAFCFSGPLRRSGTGVDLAACRAFLRHYRTGGSLATDADLRALPALLRAQRLGKVAKKSANLLAKRVERTLQPGDATRFAVVLQRESARVRWLTQQLTTLEEDP